MYSRMRMCMVIVSHDTTWRGVEYHTIAESAKQLDFKNMASNLDLFLDDLVSFIRLTSGREGCTESFAEATLVKLDGYCVLYAVIGTIQYHYGSDPSSSDLLALGVKLWELADILEEIKSRWCDLEVGISLTNPSSMLRAEKYYTGGCGRPKYVVSCEQLVFLRELHFTWTTIAQMYGISRQTLYNIRSHNMTGAEFSAFTQISDEDLKRTIHEIKLSLPECGQCMVRRILNSQGICPHYTYSWMPSSSGSDQYSSSLGYTYNNAS